jgi:hypothetical protein
MMNAKTWLALMIAVAAAYFAMEPSLEAGFTNWDDQYYVWENMSITSLDAAGKEKLWNERVLGHYHPFTMFSYAYDYEAAQLDPKRYHRTNLILHLLNTAFVFLLIWLVAKRADVALITALVFGIHPMHVEAVAWISGRKDVLFSLFYLLAFISYVYYASRKRHIGVYLAVVAFFVASLLSKAMAVSLPLMLLAYDLYRNGSISKRDIIEKVPLFILAGIFGWVAVQAQSDVGAVQGEEVYGFIDRLIIGGRNLMWYMQQAVWPDKLSCFYPYPGMPLPGPFFIGIPVVLGLGSLLFFFRSNREWLFSSLLFVLPIGLLLQVIPVGDALTADRYTYLPYIGFGFLIGMSSARVKSNLRPAIWILLGAVGIYWIAESRARCEVWTDSGTLWSNVIENYPTVSKAYNNRAQIYIQNQQFDKALADFSKAIELDPTNADAYNNRGNVNRQMKNLKEAVFDFSQSIAYKPDFAKPYHNRSWTWFELKDYQKAVEDAYQAERLGMQMEKDYIKWLEEQLGEQNRP